MRPSRRDDNESGLVLIWRQCGAFWLPMPREAGFDGLLCFRGVPYVVEVKDGNKPPSARKLTPRELEVKAALEARGVTYYVIETEDQALRLVGAK